MHDLFVLFDDYVQSFAINWLYAEEWWVLPLIVLLLLWLLQGNRWTFQAALVVWGLLILYIACFQMHWHSALACPLIFGGLGYWYARQRWNHVIARWRDWSLWLGRHLVWLVPIVALVALCKWSLLALLIVLAVVPTVFCLLTRRSGGKQSFRGYLLNLAGSLFLALPIVVLASLPTSSLLVLFIVLACAAGLMTALAVLRGGERLLSFYIKHEPRMSAYLDCVRTLKGSRQSQGGTCLLAENRIVAPNGPLSEEDRKKLTPGFAPWDPGFWCRMLFHFSCVRPFSWFFRFLSHPTRLSDLNSRFMVDCLNHERKWTWSVYEKLRYGKSLDNYLHEVAALRPLPAELNAGETADSREPAGRANARNQRLRWLAMTEALAECHFFSDPVVEEAAAIAQPDLLMAAASLADARELQHEVVRDLTRYGDGREARESCVALHFFNLSARCTELFLDLSRGLAQQQAESDTSSAEPVSPRHEPETALLHWRVCATRALDNVNPTQSRRDLLQTEANLPVDDAGSNDPLHAFEILLAGLGERVDRRPFFILRGLLKEHEMHTVKRGSSTWENLRREAEGFYKLADSLRIWRLQAM